MGCEAGWCKTSSFFYLLESFQKLGNCLLMVPLNAVLQRILTPWKLYQGTKSWMFYGTFFWKKLGFTVCKAGQPLQGMELQEKEAQKD